MSEQVDGGPASGLPRVVIVGGGFGGLSAAKALRAAPVRLTLVDRCNHHLFQPLLYQVAMAGLSPADIAYPIRSVLRRQANATTLLAEVVRVDLVRRSVTLHDGTELSYDFLVLAAGARTNYFGRDDWSRWSLGLKNIEDALEVRRRVLLAYETAERAADPEQRRRLLTFAIIGGGPTGVELAGAIRDLAEAVLARDFRQIDPSQARVTLIEMQDRVLPAGFDRDLAAKAKRQLEELGVDVRLNTRVDAIDARGVHVGDELIEAGTVLWTAGVTARTLTQHVQGAELDRTGRILVGPDCTVPGRPEVFAIGDNARFVPAGGDGPLPGVAGVAIQQGRHAARSIVATLRGEPRRPFVYRDRGIMATIGRSRAVVQMPHFRASGLIAWLTWLFVHIVLLIGFRNRLIVLINWCWAYVSYRSGARLITGWRSWDWAVPSAAEARARAGSVPVADTVAQAEPRPAEQARGPGSATESRE
jgi:NADH dehydrogenase